MSCEIIIKKTSANVSFRKMYKLAYTASRLVTADLKRSLTHLSVYIYIDVKIAKVFDEGAPFPFRELVEDPEFGHFSHSSFEEVGRKSSFCNMASRWFS